MRLNYRPLLSASLGIGTSLSFDAYVNSVFAAYLIRAFGWSRAQFALYGLVAVASVLVLPVVGRLSDRLGVRRVAMTGTLLMPVVFIGYSRMQGSFGVFLFFSALKMVFGQMTGSLVYSRLIAQNFHASRGLALTVVNSAPALLGAVAAPLLTVIIEHFGWRLAYLAVGGFTLTCGVIAVLLVPKAPAGGEPSLMPMPIVPPTPTARADFATIVGTGTFWIIAAGMFLCMIPNPLQSSQMNLMLQSHGLAAATRAGIISLFAISTIVGRLGCGLALDRLPTPLVTTICTIPPAVGFFLLGTHLNSAGVVSIAMVLVGLTIGAESDLLAYLVARYFRIRLYGTTLSAITCLVYLASAVGTLLISTSLRLTQSYSPFLFFVSATVLAGSLLFLLLARAQAGARIG